MTVTEASASQDQDSTIWAASPRHLSCSVLQHNSVCGVFLSEPLLGSSLMDHRFGNETTQIMIRLRLLTEARHEIPRRTRQSTLLSRGAVSATGDSPPKRKSSAVTGSSTGTK